MKKVRNQTNLSSIIGLRGGRLYCLIVSVLISVYIIFVLSITKLVHAEVFNCTSSDVVCLINAINEANTNDEDDTINLASGVYTLTGVDNTSDGPNGLPSITSQIIIKGAGADTTIIERDGDAPTFRIFHIAKMGTLKLNKLTVKDGLVDEDINDLTNTHGGAIYNIGRLIIKNCTISGNGAYCGGGIFNSSGGIVTIKKSNLFDNFASFFCGGGSIFNTGTDIETIINNTVSIDYKSCYNLTDDNAKGGVVNVINSTISGSSGGTGGGITNNIGTVIIQKSTISGNSADFGGGIDNFSGTVCIKNSTISDNESLYEGGGIINGSGMMSIKNSTISGNVTYRGGGINNFFFGGSVFLRNTVIANNPEGGDCAPGTITSLGHNLDSDGTCNLTETTDLPSTDPLLAPLADNGGPTMTHALLSGSPAIDAGNPEFCPSSDQRNFQRPTDGDGNSVAICDIGAYEFEADKKIDIVNDSLTFIPIPSTYNFTPDANGCPSGYAGTFSFDAELTNIGSSKLSHLIVQVVALTKESQLKNTDNEIKRAGATISVESVLNPSDSVYVTFEVCIKEKKSFRIFVDVVNEVLQDLIETANSNDSKHSN